MKPSILAAILAAAFLLAPLAYADTAAIPIGDPYTDMLQLWSSIASSIELTAHDAASAAGQLTSAMQQLASTVIAPHPQQTTDRPPAPPQASAAEQSASLAAAVASFEGARSAPTTSTETEQATSSEIASDATSYQTTTPQNENSAINQPSTNQPAEPEPTASASNFVTQDQLTAQLEQLSNSLASNFNSAELLTVPAWAPSQAIDNLSGVTITNANLTASEIPALDYLSLSGGTLSGALNVPTLNASSTNYGLLTATNASTTLLSNFGTAYFGSTATSSFDSAGDLTVAGNTTLESATSTSFFATTASSTNLFSQTASLGGLSAGTLALTNALTVTNGGTGANTFGQGWIYSNGGTGALAASTSPTVGYLFATSTTVNSSIAAGLTIGAGSATNLTITGGATAVTIQANSGGSGQINYNSKNGQSHVFNNLVNAPYFRTPANTTTLSGATIPTFLGNFVGNLSGSSTIAGDTWGANVNISEPSDNASINNGSWGELLINGNFGGNSFTGGRVGMLVQLALNSTSTLNAQANGLVGYGSKVIASVNAGGSSAGFGTTQFGLGSLFGANPWCDLETGATDYTQCIGEEIDGAIETGASVGNFVLQQLVLTSDHAVHGTVEDTMQSFGAQVGASAGVRNVIQIGGYQGQWPVDPNGYLLQAQFGENNTTVPSTAAGGIDLEQANFTGTGTTGGGFAFRSQGFSINNTGSAQIGYGYLSSTSTGLSIDVTENTISGTPTVASGGSNFTSTDLAADAYGDVVQVTASGGAVTSVSVIRRGWTNAVPTNPVSFTALNRTGSAFGSGLTLNETWTNRNDLILNPTSGGAVGIGTSSPSGRLTVWGTDTASSTPAFNVVNSASTTVFSVFDGGNAELSGSLSQSSDQRLKTNIQSLEASSSLSLIDALNPVTFNWIDPNKGTEPQLGFIAQQVLPIFPNLVSTTSPTALTADGTLSLNYIGLISPIVSAIQELSSELTSIENTVAGFAQSVTSAIGNFGQVNTNELCVGSTCVTPTQFQAMVAAAGESGTAPDASDDVSSQATDTPPVIQINGDNPSVVQVGNTYNDLGAMITGPQADLNLGITTYVNGIETSPVQVDTSAAATDTIDYVATDQNGLTSTTTRTVFVEVPSIVPSNDASTTATTSASTTPTQ